MRQSSESDADDIGARLRAARHLGGYRNVEALADELKDRRSKLGTTTLRNIERGQIPGDFSVYREVADVCGVPVEFFTADFSRLAEISEDPRSVIARKTAEAVQRAAERREARLAEKRAPRREAPES
jgi:transcriptional regulator with XRE-family HTH domain